MKVKITVECQECGNKEVFPDKDIIELEETPFYIDCVEYDENKDYEEYCQISRLHKEKLIEPTTADEFNPKSDDCMITYNDPGDENE